MPFKIQTITAFVSMAPDGEEGVLATTFGGSFMPLICANEERIAQMYPVAQQISDISGIPFKVLQFSVRTDITQETIDKYS